MTDSITRDPAITRDAKAWRDAAGVKYTEALRLVEDPLHQGILGDRIVIRDLLRALEEHPIIGKKHTGITFGRRGFWSRDYQMTENLTGTLLRDVLLSVEFLRMFTPAAEIDPADVVEVSSYTLKHIAEEILGSTVQSYLPNGAISWAAAALQMPMRRNDEPLSPNAVIKLHRLEVEFMNAGRVGHIEHRRGDHFQPPGFKRLAAVVAQANRGEAIDDALVIPLQVRPALSDFHVWLSAQIDRPGCEGRFVEGYVAGVNDSDHRPAASAKDLYKILYEIRIDRDFADAARALAAEYYWRVATR